MDKYYSKSQLKEPSPCGKYKYTHYTVEDLEGKTISTYYMSGGRKNGLSDQYQLHKMKQIVEEGKPKFDNFVPLIKSLEDLCSYKKPSTLTDHDKMFKKVAEHYDVMSGSFF